MESYAVHWFRRDLRLAGNPALHRLIDEHGGRVLGIFCFDKKFLARPDFSPVRFQFFMESLLVLREEMKAHGSDLLFLDEGPDEGFGKLFAQLKAKGKPLPHSIAWNRDYEPFALARDDRMQSFFRSQGIHTLNERDHILIEPHEVVKDSKPSAPYQVFTPYSRKWLTVLASPEGQRRIKDQKLGLAYLTKLSRQSTEAFMSMTWSRLLGAEGDRSDLLQTYRDANRKHVSIPIPKAGSLAALEQLKSFKKKIDDYGEDRDYPATDGTSRLSIFFKNGSLTIAQVIAALDLKPDEKGGRSKYLSELIWREFYYYILSKHPRVEHEAFDRRFQDLNWGDEKRYLQAWKEGQTGFPIVDAGMRQLNQTGWMHNRVRMIVASFLTKDLLVNWQHGERYFMEKLLDGDMAPNNGGWQWAASTGCDPQPYFRIFNPKLQSEKFDPKGDYIRRFVPELAGVRGKEIHAPPQAMRSRLYPAPIVDHAKQRDKALALYKASSS